MEKEIYESFGDIKQKITILTVKLDEYLKEIDETKADIKNLDKETEVKIEKLTKACSELKESINILKVEEAKNASTLNFIVRAFWIMFGSMVGIIGYLFKGMGK